MRKLALLSLLFCLPIMVWAKSQSPLMMQVHQDVAAVPGNVFSFQVKAGSRMEIKNAQLKLILPAGVELMQGATRVELSLSAGSFQSFSYKMKLAPDAAGTIDLVLSDGSGKAATRQRIRILQNEMFQGVIGIDAQPDYKKEEIRGQKTREYRLE